jgi:hypothetical protein
VEIQENESHSDDLKLKKVKKTLRSNFESLKEVDQQEKPESGLVSSIKLKYMGLSSNFGKYGHRVQDCRGRKNEKVVKQESNNRGSQKKQVPFSVLRFY